MSELTQESENYRKLADNILTSSKIIETLEKHGEVIPHGSYVANLMMNGDIDIYVVKGKNFTQEEVLEIFNEVYLSTKDKFRSYYIGGNWDDVRRGDQFPYGHYMGMKAVIEEEKWKIDIWFISKEEQERLSKEKFDITKVNVTPEQRETILRFKKYRNENSLSVSGQQIYELLIYKNVSDISELLSNINSL